MVQELWQYTVPVRRYNHLTLQIYIIIIQSIPALDWKMLKKKRKTYT